MPATITINPAPQGGSRANGELAIFDAAHEPHAAQPSGCAFSLGAPSSLLDDIPEDHVAKSYSHRENCGQCKVERNERRHKCSPYLTDLNSWTTTAALRNRDAVRTGLDRKARSFGHSVCPGNESTLIAMSKSYANVGNWTGPVRTIPPVIEVTSLKKLCDRESFGRRDFGQTCALRVKTKSRPEPACLASFS